MFRAFFRKKKQILKKARKGVFQEAHETKVLARQIFRRARGETLTPEEREAFKAQTKDLAKLLPLASLILLPGGSLMLIVLERFTPFSLLPSAFQSQSEAHDSSEA